MRSQEHKLEDVDAAMKKITVRGRRGGRKRRRWGEREGGREGRVGECTVGVREEGGGSG